MSSMNIFYVNDTASVSKVIDYSKGWGAGTMVKRALGISRRCHQIESVGWRQFFFENDRKPNTTMLK